MGQVMANFWSRFLELMVARERQRRRMAGPKLADASVLMTDNSQVLARRADLDGSLYLPRERLLFQHSAIISQAPSRRQARKYLPRSAMVVPFV
jgi:hypothetical protein